MGMWENLYVALLFASRASLVFGTRYIKKQTIISIHKEILSTAMAFIWQENDTAALLPGARLWELELALLLTHFCQNPVIPASPYSEKAWYLY